jgi:hypothetical protein
VSPHTVAEATAITQTGHGAFTAELDPPWTVVGKPNGGYLQAVAGRAAGVVAPHPQLVSATSSRIRWASRPAGLPESVKVIRRAPAARDR